MPVIPEIDPKTCTLDELVAMAKAAKDQHAIRNRNIALAEAMIARGQTTFPMGRCPDCTAAGAPDALLPVYDDGAIECPVHGWFDPPS